MSEQTYKLAFSDEMNTFYEALGNLQSNAIFQVLKGADEDEIKKRAVEITGHLKNLIETLQKEAPPEGRCGPGYRWDEVLRECVALKMAA